jgi:hypothetical protein
MSIKNGFGIFELNILTTPNGRLHFPSIKNLQKKVLRNRHFNKHLQKTHGSLKT